MDAETHLYEFVVPMVPPSWNNEERVARYAAELARSAKLSAVAVSTLDICAPAVERGPDYYTHWALTHFLLDGHHKMQAAAIAERPVQLLSLLSVDASLAPPEKVGRVPALRQAAQAPRRAH
ncbi:hypothetical protein ACIBCR_27405 [Micromonospora echinospora]|uniref:hypothetical protein n=1 Tax=Micromonospora echinospora TaxID=1877 RepID=UPI0037A7607F